MFIIWFICAGALIWLFLAWVMAARDAVSAQGKIHKILMEMLVEQKRYNSVAEVERERIEDKLQILAFDQEVANRLMGKVLDHEKTQTPTDQR